MHSRWRDEFATGSCRRTVVARIERLAEDGPFTYAAANAAVPELPDRYRCPLPDAARPRPGRPALGNHRIHVTTAERWLGRSRWRADAAGLSSSGISRLRPGVEG